MAYRNALLLLKKPVGWFVGGAIWGDTRAHGKKFQAGIQAISISGEVLSDMVTVCFNEPPVGTPTLGVTITVNSTPATFTGVINGNCIDYTLTSQNPLQDGDVVVWTYTEATGDIVGGISGEPLEDSTLTLNVRLVLPPTDWAAPLSANLFATGAFPTYTFARQDGATITDDVGVVQSCFDQESRFLNAQREFLNDGVDYGANVLGVKYTDTGSSNGVLIEEQRTNLIDTTSVLPNPTFTAPTNGQIYTLSIIGGTSIAINGVTGGTATPGSPFTFTAGADHTTLTVTGTPDQTDGNNLIQLELGAFATSIVLNPGGAGGIRNVDLLDYDPQNYADEMTFYCEFTLDRDGNVSDISSQTIAALTGDDAGGITNTIKLIINSSVGQIQYTRFGPGFQNVDIQDGPLITAGTHKVAFVHSLDNTLCRMAIDGNVFAGTGSTSPSLTINYFSLGGDTNNTTIFGGNIKDGRIWGQRLTDVQLQALTTL